MGNGVMAQTQGAGSWNILTMNIKLSEKWSALAEGQVRSLKFYDDFHYYEIKGGGVYNLGKTFAFTLAGGYYNTYSRGGNFVEPKQSEEIRLWQQVLMKQSLRRIAFEHRYRAEQRFTNRGFRNRFRYRLSCIIPLQRNSDRWYLNVSNELFFTNRPTYFERNRFFIGIGQRINSTLTVQAGYLKQFDYNLKDEVGSNFFQIMFQFNLTRKDHARNPVPDTMD
jgi:hypothetical protein